jgi:hypothetical protein
MALGQLRSAVKGRTDAARETLDRSEGKACQQVEVSDPDGSLLDLVERLNRGRARVALMKASERKVDDPEP